MYDRLRMNRKHQEDLKKWIDEKKLDLQDGDNIDRYLLLMSLGLKEPMIPTNNEGYLLERNVKTEHLSLIAASLIGSDNAETNLDNIANKESCYIESEKCVEKGFYVLEKIINESNGDNDLLLTKMMAEIDNLYEVQVKPYLDEIIN